MSIDTYAVGTVLIVASAVVAVLGLLAVRRTYNVRNLATIHEVSGQFLSIVGTLYAVLLGLIVVEAMGRFQQVETLVGDESNALAEVIYLAGGMPDAQKAEVYERASAYAQLVIDREWPLLAQGQPLLEARQAVLDLMRVVRDWEPATEREKAVYAEVLPTVSDLWNSRRQRIIASQHRIPALEWCVVILGGIITVGLTYLFVLDDLKLQITLTAMVALLIALNIFLLLMFGYPFSGDLSVSPDSFRIALFTLPRGQPIAGSH